MKVVTAEGKIIEATPISDAEEAAIEALVKGLGMDNGVYMASRDKECAISYILKTFKLELRSPPAPEAGDDDDVVEVAPEFDRELVAV